MSHINQRKLEHPTQNIELCDLETLDKEFYWSGDVFNKAGRSTIDFGPGLSGFSYKLKTEFKNLFIQFIDLNQYSSTTYLQLAYKLNAALKTSRPSILGVRWLWASMPQGNLKRISRQLYLLFNFMNQRCPEFFDGKILELLDSLKPRIKRRSNVLSDDPNLSKLTNVEFDSLVWEIWKNFDIGSSGPQVTLLRLLSCHYFRRPTQFSQLKVGDIYLDSREDISKICAPRIFFPGAKDRSSEDSFRGSKFEYRPLPDHFIDLVRLQIRDIKNSFEFLLGVNLNDDEYKKLPLFTTEHQIVHASEVLRDHFKIDPVSNLDHEIFHLTSVIIGDIIDWSSNSAIKRTADHCSTKVPISERTGQGVAVNATRMRHTGAFKLARRGVSKSLLSYIMGHTNLKSLNAYYKDPAEEARVLDEAMKGSLSQLHMAFTGKLLSVDEELKVISDSPDSILEHHSKHNLTSVGNCGKHSFCSTQTIPIPCYRCNSFQPFVGANHQQVLDALLERQRQENEVAKLGSPKNLLNPVDLSSDISCVLNVIAQCEAYKKNILGENSE